MQGVSTGLSDMDLSDADAKLSGEVEGDYAGVQISSAGDVDTDGYSDILVGANRHDHHLGAAYLIMGSSAGISDINLSAADAKFTSEKYDDQIGSSVASAGDMNNDGYDDVLIGGAIADGDTYTTGAVYIVLGSSSGIASKSMSDADAKIKGETSHDYLGLFNSSSGDFDGDGYSDILLPAYGDDTAATNSGAVYLFYGL